MSSDILKEIGKRIHDARIAKKLSQEDLAYKANLATSSISDIECGKSKLYITTFIKIIEVLGVSADEILIADVPSIREKRKTEFEELLKGCNKAELESIIQVVKSLKQSFDNNRG